MPDDLDYDDEDDDTQDDSSTIRKLRQQRRDALKRAEAAEAQAQANEAAAKKLAFVEAGVDLTDPKMGYFVKGYEGEMDAAAIKQAAVDAGFLTAPEPPGAKDLADHQAIARAAAGADAPSPDATRDAEYLAAMLEAQKRGPSELLAVIRQYRPDLVVPFAQ